MNLPITILVYILESVLQERIFAFSLAKNVRAVRHCKKVTGSFFDCGVTCGVTGEKRAVVTLCWICIAWHICPVEMAHFVYELHTLGQDEVRLPQRYISPVGIRSKDLLRHISTDIGNGLACYGYIG